MDLSILKDAPHASVDTPSGKDTSESENVSAEEVTSESFPNQEDIETAAQVTADPLADLMADFESQNAEIKSLKKFSFFSLKSFKSRLQEKGKKQLPPDTFSFLVCSKILSQPFLLGITVFIFQITIYTFLAVDLINPFSENPVDIPANVEANVRVTQFLAIFVAVLTQADLRTSLEQVNEGYRADCIGKDFAEASCGKWWFATACRFLQGALGLVVTFFLIVRDDNVFDLLVNFTAIELVSKLADAAFFLAGTGYFGSKNAEKSQEIKEPFYPKMANEKKRRVTIHFLLLVVVFSGTLAGWGVIVNKQRSNQCLCNQFFVHSLQTQVIQSGFYKLKPSRGRSNERVQYIQQNGIEESERGFMFGYCDQETAWTYSLEEDPCILFAAKSAVTTAFDIRKTISSPWVSDNLVQLDPIQFICVADTRTSLDG